MLIAVKAKDEQTGEIVFEGSLNANEVSFLLQYSINDLMNAGVQFFTQPPSEDADNESIRFTLPKDNNEFDD